MKIIGIGNAVVDILARVDNDALIKQFNLSKGSMTLVNQELSNQIMKEISGFPKTISTGGSAANTIHGLANLGLKTTFIGKTGKDEYGKFFNEDLITNNIKPVLFNSPVSTGKAITLITPDSERTFATYLGAADELSEDDLKDGIFKGYDLLYLEGYLIPNIKLIDRIMNLAKLEGTLIAMDLASYNLVRANRKRLNDLIEKYVDIVFANEEEAKELTGFDPHPAAEILSKICDIVIIKTGAKGSIVRYKNETIQIGPVKSKPVDTTGAGDLYASGFIYGLSKNASVFSCGLIGTILAGKVIEVIGAKMDEPTWKALKKDISDKIIFP